MSERFDVVVTDAQGFWHYVKKHLEAKEAVELAKILADEGMYREVLITDADDFTVFLWEAGRGVVFPPAD